MSKGRILKSIGEMAAELSKNRAVLSKEEAEANLRRMLESSKVQQRLYHGTTATEGGKGDEAIRRIKSSKEGALGSGAYLTPQPDRANLYTRPSRPDAGGNVLPVYAQIRNPLILDGPSSKDPMIEALTKLGMDEQKASRMVERAYENKGYIGKEVESRARAAGYDGLMQYRDGELAEVVSYNPNAIKSAIGNVGTYDTSVPELSKAHGGAVRKADGGAATYNEAMLRRNRKFSQTDLDQMRREVAENARRIAAEKKARLDNPPPAEMTEYNPTLQQKLGSATERGLKGLGATTPTARALSGLLTGGSTGSPLPLGMSVLDFTPAAIPVYGGQGVMNATEAAGKGNYGDAALELGLAGLDLAPGVPAARALARAAAPSVKAGAQALAPKVGDLAEQYMMKTGMALPIIKEGGGNWMAGGGKSGLIRGGIESVSKALKSAEKAKQYTAVDRGRAGFEAAEMIKRQEQVKASEALGQSMEKGIKKVGVTQADRTRVGGGNIGGPNFSALSEVDPAYSGKVWGVTDKGTASRLINESSPNSAWTTLLGSEHQLKSNPIVFDKLKRAFQKSMKEGNLSPELEAKINQNLALEFGEGASIRDPKVWKMAQESFGKRGFLGDLMMGQGVSPKKGGVALGGEKSGKGVIFKPSDILIRETEPSLLHPEHGGDVPTFAVGPRLFTLGDETHYRPDLHPGFPTLIEGKDLGHNINPVPHEVFLRDWSKGVLDKRGRKPGYFDLTLGLEGEGLPSQELSDEYIRHLLREGFKKGGIVRRKKKGGVVRKAEGGQITSDDLVIEERKL